MTTKKVQRVKPGSADRLPAPSASVEEKFEAFVEFVVQPYKNRMKNYGFTDQKDLAVRMGLTPQTLTNWKQRPDFTDKVESAARIFLAQNAAEFTGGILGHRKGIRAPAKLRVYMDFVFRQAGGGVVINIEQMSVNSLLQLASKYEALERAQEEEDG